MGGSREAAWEDIASSDIKYRGLRDHKEASMFGVE